MYTMYFEDIHLLPIPQLFLDPPPLPQSFVSLLFILHQVQFVLPMYYFSIKLFPSDILS